MRRPVLSSHRDGKITNTELDLIHEYQSAVETFAHGTGFNLYWGSVWKRDWIEVNSPSTDDMRSFFEGEPDGAVRLLTARQEEALETIARCRRELGLDRKPGICPACNNRYEEGVNNMSSILRRIGARHWSIITKIADEEGREARNVLDLVLDRGLAARAEGRWPTPIPRPQSESKA